MQEKLAQAKALHQQGQLREAVRLYQEILQDDPACAEALHSLGVAALQAGQAGQAAKLIKRALDVSPAEAAYWGHFGIALTQLNRLDEAIAAYTRAIELNPRNAEALSNLGNTLQRQGRLDQAVQVYRLAMKVAPRYAQAAYNLGIALKAKGSLTEAAQAYRTAVAVKPDYDRALTNLGNVLQELGEFEDAIAAYRRAVEINPRLARGHANLASLQLEMGALEAAMSGYERALELDPDDADTRYNLAQALLLQGRFGEGWDAQESRWQSTQLADQARHFSQPTWEGEDLAGRSLLVWAEQGVGDQVQFAGLLSELEGRGGPVQVDCDARLVPLFRRSFPAMTFEPRPKTAADHPGFDAFDCQIAMGSLGRLLRRAESDFPRHEGYLLPDPTLAQDLAGRLRSEARGRTLVGLSWGSRGGRTGKARSAPLQQWAPILDREDCCFVNLQYGAATDELAAVREALGVEVLALPEVDPLRDLDGFAALIAALDLVITVGNSTAHLAGALARPTWVMLPLVPSWRWLLAREDSPWYPAARLFRQERRGDWSAVVGRIAEALGRFEP